ncbi:MAG: HAD-IIA family hydrolase [Actinobacteria bacterium]|nr:HAD-IIA family hydrolase [Actinomycetota bacterium]MCA1720188.1 HAD-IIA family hydrolase [Actinomycetota bacterium]
MTAPRGEALGSCDRPLADAYDAALYDLDGVLYLGAEPIPHAAESVRTARERGMRAAYVTNNASRRPAVVAAHLTQLGIPADPADVVTSAQAAVRVLHQRVDAGALVLVLGAPGLAQEVELGGFRTTRTAEPDVVAVVQGYDAGTGWAQLAEASVALRSGALWVATNTDSTLPSPRGPLPGNGAMVAALRTATGLEPVVAGKPEPALHLESVQRVNAQRPLVVGDRLDTDVLGAVRGGADSLLVLTGVVDVAQLLAAPRGSRPTYVAPNLRGLLQAQAPVARGRCGDALAVLEDGVLRVAGSGVEVLRAACDLAWRAADEGRPVVEVEGL